MTSSQIAAPLNASFPTLEYSSFSNPPKWVSRIIKLEQIIDKFEACRDQRHHTHTSQTSPRLLYNKESNNSSPAPSDDKKKVAASEKGKELKGKEKEKDEPTQASDQENWPLSLYIQFVEHLNTLGDKKGVPAMELLKDDIVPPEDSILYPVLSAKKKPVLFPKFEQLRKFNKLIRQVLPFIDLSLSDYTWSFSYRVIKLKRCVFASVRSSFITSVLTSMTMKNLPQLPTITLDRDLAAKATSDPVSQGNDSFFAQAYKQVQAFAPASLIGGGRAWHVRFNREGAIDQGGPYRDSLTRFCVELQSDVLPLLIPCPNSIHNIGMNREKWVPNPSANASLHLSMFSFLGKLLGVVLHNKNLLALDLPSTIWKSLVGEPLERSDLESIDKHCVSLFNKLLSDGLNEELFADLFDDLTFTTTLSNGQIVELIPGGSNISVTWKNRTEYIRKTIEMRLNESKVQIEAIKSGMSQVIPLPLLKLIPWEELETLICGRPDFDVELLKKNTYYEGIAKESPVVTYFWNILASFTSKQREMFLRFVWGQSRLPSIGKFDPFKIQPLDRANPDESFPEASTCFFTLELPSYSSQDILREKLLYSITNCVGIDADYDDNDYSFDDHW